MERVNVPAFITHASQMEVLRRVESFTKLCLKFTTNVRCGKDISVNVMKELLKYQPLLGFPEMNNVLNLLKDTVLGFQCNRMNGSGPIMWTLQQKVDVIPKHRLFSKELLDIAKYNLVNLWNDVYHHKQIMKTLTKVQKDFITELKRLKNLKTECVKVKAKLAEMTENGEHGLNSRLRFLVETQHAKGLEKYVEKQKEKTSKCLDDLLDVMDMEKDVRLDQVKRSATALENMLLRRIFEVLCIGYNRLVRFTRNFNLPRNVRKALREVNILTVARSVYRKLSVQYVFPTVNDSTLDVLIPSCKIESPDLSNKIQKPKLSESAENLPSDSDSSIVNAQEELYVWSCVNKMDVPAPTMMKVVNGDKIKQKCCSGDGEIAFGWKRLLPLGPKVYGFYPTQYTRVVV